MNAERPETRGSEGGGDGGVSALGMTCAAYVRRCKELGVKGGEPGARDRYRGLFVEGRVDEALGGARVGEIGRVVESPSDEGTVVKFTQRVPGVSGSGAAGGWLETESVVIPMIGKKRVQTATLCVSSQVGCAMGCTFCQTAQMGLVRSLSVEEIVGQWWAAAHVLGTRPRNLVFMGMGEPLDNLDAVMGAIEVLTDSSGAAVPMSRIVVSTVGRIDGLRRLARRVHEPGWHRLNLAVSLNAPNDEVRSSIMPINRAMPLGALREALLEWPIYGAAKICFEYVLIPGVNDAREHAAQAADFLHPRAGSVYGDRRLPGMINVIPYNPREDSPWAAPEEASVDRFLGWLIEEGVFAKRRRTKGRENMAACGQLGNLALRRKPRRAAAGGSVGVGLSVGGVTPGEGEVDGRRR